MFRLTQKAWFLTLWVSQIKTSWMHIFCVFRLKQNSELAWKITHSWIFPHYFSVKSFQKRFLHWQEELRPHRLVSSHTAELKHVTSLLFRCWLVFGSALALCIFSVSNFWTEIDLRIREKYFEYTKVFRVEKNYELKDWWLKNHWTLMLKTQTSTKLVPTQMNYIKCLI